MDVHYGMGLCEHIGAPIGMCNPMWETQIHITHPTSRTPFLLVEMGACVLLSGPTQTHRRPLTGAIRCGKAHFHITNLLDTLSVVGNGWLCDTVWARLDMCGQ